jgi:hypothetical protein
MGVPLMRGRAAAGSSASIAVRPSAVKPALRAEVRRQAIPMVRLGCGSANRSSFSRWSRNLHREGRLAYRARLRGLTEMSASCERVEVAELAEGQHRNKVILLLPPSKLISPYCERSPLFRMGAGIAAPLGGKHHGMDNSDSRRSLYRSGDQRLSSGRVLSAASRLALRCGGPGSFLQSMRSE